MDAILRGVLWWNGSWPYVLDHLWQSTLFCIPALAATMLLKGAPARFRYGLWMLAALKFLIPSALIESVLHLAGVDLSSLFLTVAWATSNPLWVVDHQRQIFHAASGSVETDTLGLLPAMFAAVWLSGALILAFRSFRTYLRFAKNLKNHSLVCSGREKEILKRACTRAGIKRKIALVASSSVTEPSVWGNFFPVIVFPAGIAKELDDSELESVLLHELAHVSRWDNLAANVQMVLCCLFWFHPLVWWIDRGLLSEREKACDDRVLQVRDYSRVYAAGLMKVVKFSLGIRVAGVSCANGSGLRNRIENITRGVPGNSTRLNRVILAAAAALLLFSSLAAINIDDCVRYELVQELCNAKLVPCN